MARPPGQGMMAVERQFVPGHQGGEHLGHAGPQGEAPGSGGRHRKMQARGFPGVSWEGRKEGGSVSRLKMGGFESFPRSCPQFGTCVP